jgi:hypothetical protein
MLTFEDRHGGAQKDSAYIAAAWQVDGRPGRCRELFRKDKIN